MDVFFKFASTEYDIHLLLHFFLYYYELYFYCP